MALKVIFFGLAIMVCASAVMITEVTERDDVTMPNADVQEAPNANDVPDEFTDFSDQEEESLNNLSNDDVLQSEQLKEEQSLEDEAPEEPQEDEEKADETPAADVSGSEEESLEDETPKETDEDKEKADEASADDVSPSEPLKDEELSEESFEEETPEEPSEDEGETPEAEDDKSTKEPCDEDFKTSEVAEDEESNEELCDGEPCNQPLEDEVENEPLPEDEPTSVIEDEEDDGDVFHEEDEANIAEDEDAPTVAEDAAKLPNPCKTKNGGCSDKCYNLFGHAFCFCTKPGQTLGTDTKSCVAIDKGPCSKKNGGCSDKCINVFGDAVCVCTKSGYVLDKSKKKCVKLVCPSMKCTKKCQYGFQKDDNGCNTCECNRLACPLKTCLLVCPIGYVLDKNGCAKCQCKLPLPGPTTLKQELIHLNVAGKPKSKEVRVRLTLDAFKYQALRFVPETCFLAASKLTINPIRTYLVKFRYPVDKTYIQRQLTPTEFEFSFKKNLKNYRKDVLNYLHCRCRVCSKNSSQCNFANSKVLGKLSANKKEDELADESDGEVYQDEYVNVSALVE